MRTEKSMGVSFLTAQSQLHMTLKERIHIHRGKGKKCWKPAFFPLPTMLSTLSKIFHHLSYFQYVLSQ